MGSADASTFFVPDDDGSRFVSTERTRGPWSSAHQHGGPSAALMARAVERCASDGPKRIVARMTVELLRPIPIAPLRVETAELTTGRRVRRIGAKLETAEGGVEVARAVALLIRTADVPLPQRPAEAQPPRAPDRLEPFVLDFFLDDVGYHTSMDLRFAAGTFGAGPTKAWMRMRVPLVPGETPSPLQRVMIAADSGNGVSIVVDPSRYLFVNPDLTVHLSRMPRGEWVCVDAETTLRESGHGLAESRLWDVHGPIGRAAQSLYVAAR